MPLTNYTTSVSAEKSLQQIQSMLTKAGADSITIEYNDGRPAALSFSIPSTNGPERFTLPARPNRVRAVLTRQKVEPRYLTQQHAERVAWAILRDWVRTQLAIIASEMVTLPQVMFAYLQTDDTGRPLFDLYTERRQLHLAAGTAGQVFSG